MHMYVIVVFFLGEFVLQERCIDNPTWIKAAHIWEAGEIMLQQFKPGLCSLLTKCWEKEYPVVITTRKPKEILEAALYLLLSQSEGELRLQRHPGDDQPCLPPALNNLVILGPRFLPPIDIYCSGALITCFGGGGGACHWSVLFPARLLTCHNALVCASIFFRKSASSISHFALPCSITSFFSNQLGKFQK